MKQNRQPSDLNDLFLFAKVVELGGFSAVSRKLSIPKSTISRRIAKLESQLGLQLIQRNTYQFQTTNIGQIYYQYCLEMSEKAETAHRFIAQYQDSVEPQGIVRFSCPVEVLDHYLADELITFMQLYPKVQLDIKASNYPIDLLKESQDFAIRVRQYPLPDSHLIARKLCDCQTLLVANPNLVPRCLTNLTEITNYETLTFIPATTHQWRFFNPEKGWKFIPIQPKLTVLNLSLIKKAILAEQGIGILPLFLIKEELKQGKLHAILPEGWKADLDTVHAIYLSRQGMLPAAATLLDFLQDKLQGKNDLVY